MPSDKEKLQKEYAESMLKMALYVCLEREGQQLLEEARELREAPDAPQPDEKFIALLERIERRYERGEKYKKLAPVFKRAVLKISLGIALLTALFAGTLAVSSSFRGAVLEWLAIRQEKYTLFTQESVEWDDSPRSTLGEGVQFAPGRLPLGFQEVEASGNRTHWVNYYENGQGEYIEFYQSIQAGATSLKGDSEEAEFYNTMVLREGIDATIYEKDGVTTILWEDSGYILRVKSNLERDVLLQIAQSVGMEK